MADKKYLDYDGLLYFWQKIKARFDGAISSISGDGSSTTITFTKVDGTTGTFVTKDTTYSAATQSDAGLMSAADKTKLDGIATGANNTTVDSSLSSSSTNPVQNKVINTALAAKAPLASPALTGTPTAPTAASGTNTTQIATTAFVKDAVDTSARGLKIFKTVKVGSTSIVADSATDTLTLEAGNNVTLTPDATNDKVTIAATDTTYSAATTSAAGLMSPEDKTKLDGIETGATAITVDSALSSSSTNPVQNKAINTALGNKANLASPTFTGTPKAPTASAGTNTTQIATTAFVKTAVTNGTADLAPKASPALTGTPTAPTAAAGTNTTQIATTAFVKTAVDTAVSGLYKYKGSVATASDLPSTGNVTGDVWDIQQTSTYGPPGTNVVWNGTAWDALGGLFEITSITNAEIDTICAA